MCVCLLRIGPAVLLTASAVHKLCEPSQASKSMASATGAAVRRRAAASSWLHCRIGGPTWRRLTPPLVTAIGKPTLFPRNHQLLRTRASSTGAGAGVSSSSSDREQRLSLLIGQLLAVDTAALCDADKALLARQDDGSEDFAYAGLSLMDASIRPRNYVPDGSGAGGKKGDGGGIKMIGVARTVRATELDDFLAVLRGLEEALPGEILVVQAAPGSSRAVAGGLFLSEAIRRGLGGIVVDGAVRDVEQLRNGHRAGDGGCPVYSRSVTPYSGTVQSLGETQVPVECGGITVQPGDVVIGDIDGVLAGSLESFERVIGAAEGIVRLERSILTGIREGIGLHSMTNYDEHREARSKGDESSLQFRPP